MRTQIVAVAIALGLVAAPALAASSRQGVDHGRRLAGPFCIDKSDGTVHTRAASKRCLKTQIPKTGLAVPLVPGPAGPAGAVGATGPQGPAGPAGPAGRDAPSAAELLTLEQRVDQLEQELRRIEASKLQACAGEHGAILVGPCHGGKGTVYLLTAP